MQTIAKKVVQNWAAKGYISDDEVEMLSLIHISEPTRP